MNGRGLDGDVAPDRQRDRRRRVGQGGRRTRAAWARTKTAAVLLEEHRHAEPPAPVVTREPTGHGEGEQRHVACACDHNGGGRIECRANQ
jgi:hypothetical protein